MSPYLLNLDTAVEVPPVDDQPETPHSGFPTDALPEPLRSMVRDAARQTSTPEALCAAAGLGTASAAIGSGYRVRSGEGRETPANLFLLSFAESGTGKGQVFGVMSAPLHEKVREMMEEWRMETRPRHMAELEAANADLEQGKKALRPTTGAADAAAAGETIREAIKRQDEAMAALARSPMVNIGNATAEAIVEFLANAPAEAGTIISAEGRDSVANLLGRYSKDGRGSDEPIYLQAYSGDMVVHTRKGKPPLTLSAPCLSLCLAAQPDIWEKMSSDPRLMESGFLARCLIFDAKAKASRPSTHRIPDRVKSQWSDTIRKLIDIRQVGEPSIVIPSQEASAIIYSTAEHAADQRDDGGWVWCRSFAARLAENAWRIALVFHALEHPGDAAQHQMSAKSAANAVIVANWFFGETLALLAPARSKKHTARLERLLAVFRERGTTSMSIRELGKSHGFDEAELVVMASEFSSRMNIIKSKPGPQGGQPSRLVCIPPRLSPPPIPAEPPEPPQNAGSGGNGGNAAG